MLDTSLRRRRGLINSSQKAAYNDELADDEAIGRSYHRSDAGSNPIRYRRRFLNDSSHSSPSQGPSAFFSYYHLFIFFGAS